MIEQPLALVAALAAMVAAAASIVGAILSWRNWQSERKYKTKFHLVDIEIMRAEELRDQVAKLSTHITLLIKAKRKGIIYENSYEVQYLMNRIRVSLNEECEQDKTFWSEVEKLNKLLGKVKGDLPKEYWGKLSEELLSQQYLVLKYGNNFSRGKINIATRELEESSK